MGFLKIIPRQGTFVAQYNRNATPETLAAIMSYDSTSIDASLFTDFMDFRILIERECARLACIKLNTKNLLALNQATRAVNSAANNPYEDVAEAIFNYHKCIVEISGNGAFFMVFQSFEKMMRNMIQMHYQDRSQLVTDLKYFNDLTTAIAHRDVYEADNLMYNVLNLASKYLATQLKEKESEINKA
jgi:DNA-binding FadR family transcriptional regulator